MLGLSRFSGKDKCDFQLGLLNDVSRVPQNSSGCAWTMTPRGVLEECNSHSSWGASKISMPESPGCMAKLTFSSKTSFCNRELGGNDSAGWWREIPCRVWLYLYYICPWSKPGLRDWWSQAETATGNVLKLGIWMDVDLRWRLHLHPCGLLVEIASLHPKI